MKVQFYIEHNQEKFDTKDIIDSFKELWKEKGNRVKDLDKVEIYFKPEEKACYYVTKTNEGANEGSFTL